MKGNRFACLLVLVLLDAPAVPLHAQDDAAIYKSFEDVRVKAEKGDPEAQERLAHLYLNGLGVSEDGGKAMRWLRKAAEQGRTSSQTELGIWLWLGHPLGNTSSAEATVSESPNEAAVWLLRAAAKGDELATFTIGTMYAKGEGVKQNLVESYKWFSIAANIQEKDDVDLTMPWSLGTWQTKRPSIADLASKARDKVALRMTPEQIAEAQRLARDFRTGKPPESGVSPSGKEVADSSPAASGTGFFIAEDGFLVTNEHVVKDARQIRLVTEAGLISAKVVKVDAANDLALLKAEGRFAPLPIAASRTMRLGGTVATVGFPNIGLQGFAPKLAKGEIASLSGAQDDPRCFQISVPVLPGNSGGALVDEQGNVVGVVAAALSAEAALQTSGALPQNVNYAVKSSFLLSFLESVPEVAAKLKQPSTKDRKFEDVVKSAEQAAVLVLVY